ncbi:Regulation of nuclear pre-mRNA domain-containing protein 2 [Chamberlinius hualienensis]
MAASSSSSTFNEGNFEKRLLNVNNTQECIQTLSLWCVHHKAHFKKIIEVWFKVFKKAKLNHRLSLFYLANDVIQNSKRKGFTQFLDSWKPMLKKAVPYVRDEEIRNQVERILVIWDSRAVYDSAFIKELQTVFGEGEGGSGAGHTKTGPTAVETKILTEFKPLKLVDKIRKFKKVETEVEAKQKQFSNLKIDVCSTETLKNLKDKSHGQKFTGEFEDATIKLEEYVESLQREVKERTSLLEILTQSELYYETQKKEVKIVGNAYKNFGSRVKNLKNKLEEFIPNLPSPVPSPSIDAPSPVDSSDEGSPRKNENKDNTEAVDMEMSDDENDNTDSAPSPEGSPVGLSLSPKVREKHSLHSSSSHAKSPGKKDKKTHATTVASLLAQISKSSAKNITSSNKQSASSLDIRLSNLMQNIPNFTSNLFGGRPNFNNSGEVGQSTPVKDEESGTGSVTPLQDETREHLKDSHGGTEGGTPTITDIFKKLVSSGSSLNVTPSPNPSSWSSSQTQPHHQPQWFNQRQSSHLPNVRQLSVPDFNLQNPGSMFMDVNYEPSLLPSIGGGQYRNGDRNEQTSVERQGRPNSIGYRRNSNIVELTPSPTRASAFEDPLTGSNLVPLGRKPSDKVIHEENLVPMDHNFSLNQQRLRSGLTNPSSFSQLPNIGRGNDNMESEYSHESRISTLLEGATINSNLRMIVPVGSYSKDENNVSHDQVGSFSKIETVGSVRDSLLEAPSNVLDQWENAVPNINQQGEQLYQQMTPPQGWHSLNSPPPRRETPSHSGAYRGFRFPRRVPVPRRVVREWNPLNTSPKRPLLSSLGPRWAHNNGPPY